MDFHYLFKFILVGDANVGKSCILFRYIGKELRDEYDPTIGVEFCSKIFQQNDKTIKIQIWDTAGQKQFLSVTRSYYKNSIGVLLVFDITNKESFYDVQKRYKEVHELAGEHANIILVGNKIDLKAQRQIPTLEAKAFADQYKMLYIETSAKAGENIELIFQTCIKDIIEKINTKIIDISKEVGGIKLGELSKQEAAQQIQEQQVKKEQDNN